MIARVVATVAMVVAVAEGCEGGGTWVDPNAPQKTVPQFDVLDYRKENRGLGVYDYKLLVNFRDKDGKADPRWIGLRDGDEYKRCSSLGVTYPACLVP